MVTIFTGIAGVVQRRIPIFRPWLCQLGRRPGVVTPTVLVMRALAGRPVADCLRGGSAVESLSMSKTLALNGYRRIMISGEGKKHHGKR